MSFWTSADRTARKSHICDHCRSTIPAGTRYRYGFGVQDGSGYSWRSHLDCAAFASKLWACYCLDYDEGVDLSEEWSNDTEAMKEWRGHYPHVICRFEFHQQKFEIKYGRWVAP